MIKEIWQDGCLGKIMLSLMAALIIITVSAPTLLLNEYWAVVSDKKEAVVTGKAIEIVTVPGYWYFIQSGNTSIPIYQPDTSYTEYVVFVDSGGQTIRATTDSEKWEYFKEGNKELIFYHRGAIFRNLVKITI